MVVRWCEAKKGGGPRYRQIPVDDFIAINKGRIDFSKSIMGKHKRVDIGVDEDKNIIVVKFSDIGTLMVQARSDWGTARSMGLPKFLNRYDIKDKWYPVEKTERGWEAKFEKELEMFAENNGGKVE